MDRHDQRRPHRLGRAAALLNTFAETRLPPAAAGPPIGPASAPAWTARPFQGVNLKPRDDWAAGGNRPRGTEVYGFARDSVFSTA